MPRKSKMEEKSADEKIDVPDLKAQVMPEPAEKKEDLTKTPKKPSRGRPAGAKKPVEGEIIKKDDSIKVEKKDTPGKQQVLDIVNLKNKEVEKISVIVTFKD